MLSQDRFEYIKSYFGWNLEANIDIVKNIRGHEFIFSKYVRRDLISNWDDVYEQINTIKNDENFVRFIDENFE